MEMMMSLIEKLVEYKALLEAELKKLENGGVSTATFPLVAEEAQIEVQAKITTLNWALEMLPEVPGVNEPAPQAAPMLEGVWRADDTNDTMRHPELSDLIGGSTDVPDARITGKSRWGVLAMEHCQKRLVICVLKSNAGYYIGTADESGPCSRESQEYWPRHDLAVKALVTGDWTQKEAP
jgi:hypothetical protein